MSKLYHGLTNCKSHKRKGRQCPYCIKGSKPVDESLLEMTDAQITEFIIKETRKIKSGDFDDGVEMKR